VTANVLSPGAISLATADQSSLLQQTLLGDALAASSQDSTISQGETSSGDLLGSASQTTGTLGEPAAGTGAVTSGTSLLDIAADLDLDLDLAAPIDAAIAANANIAAPIDAAVSANILSPDAVSLATANQDSVLIQTLQGTASATTDQSSLIDQGELTGGATTP